MDHDAFRATLEALRQERSTVEAKLVKIDHAISAIEDLWETPLRRPGSATVASPAIAQASGTVSPSYPDMAERILQDAGKPLHIVEIVKRAQGRGWHDEKDVKAVRNAATGTLDRKVKKGDTFTKPAPAIYGLARWGQNGTASREQQEIDVE